MKKKRIVISFAILSSLLILLVMANLFIGSADLSPLDVLDILSGKNGGDTERLIVLSIRLPRLIAAAVLGGALALSGFLLQTYFNNPIAGPFVLGISSGAKLCVALVMIVSLSAGKVMSSFSMIFAAFVGSLLSMGFILLISHRIRGSAILIVCGVMIGYICSAFTDIIVTFADDSNIVNLHNWSRGSFSGITWGNVFVMVPVVAVTFLLTFLQAKPMSAYQQGEAFVKNIGVDIRGFSVVMILLSSLLSASVTAFAGPISFLGVAAPHLMKKLLGTAKPIYMIPAGFLGGACFCLFCDLAARTVFAPTELSISTVTAIFGAPIVIYMMLVRRRIIN